MWVDSIYDPGQSRHGKTRLALLASWLLLALCLVWKHAVWRDEVRALSFALNGNSVFAMLHGMHGEGHPSLWYLLLRGAHVLLPSMRVLQVVAFLVALAAMYLLTMRSPFSPWVIGLILFGRFGVYEYVVMARNYGISMLLMFLLAYLYPKHRERGFVLGGLLLLLANTNAQSVLLVGAFLVFWLLDTVWGEPALKQDRLRVYWKNLPLPLIGIVLCAVTILPTINDSAMISHPHGGELALVVAKTLVLPATALELMVHMSTMVKTMMKHHLGAAPLVFVAEFVLSILLVASVLGLRRRAAALVGALTGLFGFALFFAVIYPGGFRHQALWLVFLLTMYWIAGERATVQGAGGWGSRFGYLALFLVLLVQGANGLNKVVPGLLKDKPESRVRDLAAVIKADPTLKDAIVMAAPDYLVEALPYYLPNDVYLTREHRFGKIVFFTRKATLQLSLGDLLREAQELHAQTGKPVILLMGHEPNPDGLDDATMAAVPTVLDEGYAWTLSVSPEDVKKFRASTRLLRQFGPVGADSSETFNAYVLE